MNDLKAKYHVFKGVELPAMMKSKITGDSLVIIAVENDGNPIGHFGAIWSPDQVEPIPDIYDDFEKAVKGKKIKWRNPSYETTFLKWAGDAMPDGYRFFEDPSGYEWTFFKNKGPLGGWTIVEKPEQAEKERDELKELLAECAYSKHTQEAMSKDLFDRICKVLEKEAGR